MNVFRKNQEITLSAPLTDPASCRMILFRSAKIERSGFLHSAEFFEICKKSLRSVFALRIYEYAKNRCALFL
ncbi:MAG: hypothetical protein BWK80_01570, partial [Desulfobacteraceae bacterium IS3]